MEVHCLDETPQNCHRRQKPICSPTVVTLPPQAFPMPVHFSTGGARVTNVFVSLSML